MVVKVTKIDIEIGKRFESYNCPVARALNRFTRKSWSVGPDYAVLRRGRNHVSLPCEAAKFIARFDGRLPVKPFKFDFDFKRQPARKK